MLHEGQQRADAYLGVTGNNKLPITLPETNIAHGNPIFPGKYHQNGGFSWAMLVLGSVSAYS